jgi:hypothetical protein
MTHFQFQPIHPVIESDSNVQDMQVEITSSFDTQMNTSLSLSSTSQNQRNAINESNSANQISLFTLDDSGAFSGCKSKSVTASTFSDESIVSRGTPLVMKFDRIPFKNITLVEESDDDMMYHIFNFRDVSFGTLVNSSTTASVIFTGDDENAILELNAQVNGVALTKLGSRNAIRLKESGQFPIGPKSKDCADCGEAMDWRTTGQMTRAKKNGPYYYHKNHNESCQKENISIKVKEKVTSGNRCHNPRCSGSNPSFLWDRNQKLYCAIECIVGYQEWNQEVSHNLHHFSNRFPSRNWINGWGLSSLSGIITNFIEIKKYY